MATFRQSPDSSDQRMRVWSLAVAAVCACVRPAWHAGAQRGRRLATSRDLLRRAGTTRRSPRPPPSPISVRCGCNSCSERRCGSHADPANAEQRRAAVAGFLVELAAARLESDWGRLSDLIEWTCAQLLRASGPPTAFERSWHMATHRAGRPRARRECGCWARTRGCPIRSRGSASRKRRSAEPAAPDARDRTLPGRSAVPARARGGVDVGPRCGADPQRRSRGVNERIADRRGRRNSRRSRRSSR